ncbi:heavy metal-associated isoprenylated plant protein 32-like [Aristolochia californica]|uniref:heavy metal-associated isoprenylated plant protein 32-like n=1 Tax=Aristolochia californica TaxID=171875 RepID=UPI0035DFF82E
MSKEPELKTIELKVYVHCCDGCKRKVKKALQTIEGVVRTEVHASLPKVTVEVRKVDAQILIKKLGKIGKPAEIWTNASGAESAQKNSKPKAKDGENEKKSSNEKEKCPSGANEKANKNENSEKGSAVNEGKKDKKDVKDGTSSNSSPPEVDKKVSSSPPEDHTIRPGIVHYTGDAASGTYPYTPVPPPYLPQTYYMMTAYSAPPMYYVQDPYNREMSTNRRQVRPSEPMLADYFDDEDSVGCSMM